MINFSFIDDPRWSTFDDAKKEAVLEIAFEKSVASDDRFKEFPEEKKSVVRDVFMEQAEDYERYSGAPEERGLLGKAASSLGRGIIDTIGMAGHALEVADLEPREIEKEPGFLDKTARAITDWSEKTLEESELLRPSKRELRGEEGFVARGVRGGIRALPLSASPWVAAGTGALIGSTFGPGGTVIGGAAGGLVGLVTMFGAGTYGQDYKNIYEELSKDPNVSEEEKRERSHRGALTSAGFETGTELAQDVAALFIFGGSKVLTTPLKATLANMTRKPYTTLAKGTLKQMPIEVGGEMVAGGGQAWAQRREGLLTGPTIGEGVKESIIPAVVLSLFMGAGATGLNRAQTHGIIKALNSDNVEERRKAADIMTERIKVNTDDTALATTWRQAAEDAIQKGEKFDFKEKLVDFASVKMAEDIEREQREAGIDPIDKIDKAETADEAINAFNEAVSPKEKPVFERPEDIEVRLSRLGEERQPEPESEVLIKSLQKEVEKAYAAEDERKFAEEADTLITGEAKETISRSLKKLKEAQIKAIKTGDWGYHNELKSIIRKARVHTTPGGKDSLRYLHGEFASDLPKPGELRKVEAKIPETIPTKEPTIPTKPESIPELPKPEKVEGAKAGEVEKGEKEVWDVFNKTTDMPLYDNILKNPDYFKKAKGLESRIELMVPGEYLKRQAEVKGVELEKDLKIIDRNVVEKIKESIKTGERKLNMLSLEPEKKNQEGRHRAIAAKEMGIKQVPVQIIELIKETKPQQKDTWFTLGKKVADEYTKIDQLGETTILRPRTNFVKQAAKNLGISQADAQRALTVYNSAEPLEQIKQIKKEPPKQKPRPTPKPEGKEAWEMRSVEVTSEKAKEVFPLEGKINIINEKPVYIYSTKLKWGNEEKTFEIQTKNPLNGVSQAERLHKKVIKQALSEGKPVPESVLKDYPELKPPPSPEKTDVALEEETKGKKKVSTKGQNIRTLRGYVNHIGKINKLNFKGEVDSLPLDAKYLFKNDGIPIDDAVRQLREDDWLDKDATVSSFLEELRINPAILSRDRLARDISEKKEHEKTKAEKKFEKETAWEPEAPPKGEYVTIRAEDLPEGKKVTLIESKSKEGWDVYEVQEKDPFSITLVDGEAIELKPLDKVQVLKEDLLKDQKTDTLEKSFKQVKESLDLFGKKKPGQIELWSMPKPEKEKKPRAKRKTKPPSREAQLDLFTGKQEQPIQPGLFKDFIKGSEKVVKKTPGKVQKPETGTVEGAGRWVRTSPTGRVFESPSLVAKNSSEVASLLSSIGKQARESLYTVAVDKDGNILEVFEHSKGTKSGSQAHPVEVAGHILNIPKANKVYYVHNHPSGDTISSREDVESSRMMGNILSLKNIYIESFVIAKNKWRSVEFTMGHEEIIKPVAGKEKVEVVESLLTEGESGEIIDNSEKFKKVLKNKYGGKEGILFFDVKLRELGFMSWPTGESIKKASAQIIAASEALNAVGYAINLNEPITYKNRAEFIRNFATILNKHNLQLFEILEKGKSYADTGILRAMTNRLNIPFEKLLSKEPLYHIGKSIPIVGKESLIDLLRKTPPLRKMTIGLSKDGSVWVRNKQGKGFNVKSVVHIEPDKAALKVSYGRMLSSGEFIKGKYQTGTIELHRAMADEWTATHETLHAFFDLGLISPYDAEILSAHVKKLNKQGKWDSESRKPGSEEDWVIYATEFMRNRSVKGTVGKILQKIADFVDAFVNIFKRTARGVIRDIESGRISEREGVKPGQVRVPEYEKTAGRWYSQMRNFLFEKLPGKGTPDQFKTSVNSWALKGLIKKEELEWSGLIDWLDGKEGKVTKQDVLDFLDENQVRLEEVEKGGDQELEFKETNGEYWNDAGTAIINEPTELGEEYGEDNWTIYTPDNEKLVDGFITAAAAIDYAKAELQDLTPVSETKFSQYTLPGGKGYKELLLRMPMSKTNKDMVSQKEFGENYNALTENERMSIDSILKADTQYTSSHWEEPNVIAHIRFDERTGPKGEKILHISEIQSDWHQEGRKKGYKQPELKQKNFVTWLKDNGYSLSEDEIERQFKTRFTENATPLVKKWQVEQDKAFKNAQGVPDAPFKKTWPLLTIKRMVRYAAENGFDAVSWDTGEVQADRYDLSKQVKEIYWNEDADLLEFVDINDKEHTEHNVPKDKLADYVGKEAAEKLTREDTLDPETSQKVHVLKGVDLKVGGEGMKGFYDKILPAAVNKFFNKKAWGKAKAGIGMIQTDVEYPYLVVAPDGSIYNAFKTIESARVEARELGKGYVIENSDVKTWQLPITPEMKSKALSEGMPLYQVSMSEFKKSTSKGKIPDVIKEKFKSEITIKEKIEKISEAVKTKDFWDATATQIIDRLHPVKKAGEKAYRLHRIETGTQAVFAMLMEHGKLDWDKSGYLRCDERKQGFLPFLRTLGKDWHKFPYWVAAKRAAVLEEQGREKWLDKKARDEIFEWAGGENNPKWEEAAKELKEFNANILDVAEKSGLINPNERKVWEQEFYVPFYRMFEDEKSRSEFLKAPRKNKKFISAQIKRLMGAERKLGDPLENLMHNWMHLISESMRNIARAEAYNYSMENKTDLIEDAQTKDVYSFYSDKEKKVVYMNKRTKEPVLMFQEEGKPKYFKVNDPELFNAMTNLNARHFDNFLLKMMGSAKRWLTYGATFGPGFRIANLLRDTMHTAMINKSFKPFIDSARGVAKAWREDEEYIAFMASGAGFGSSYVRADDPATAAKYIQRIIAKEGKSVKDRILDTPKKMLDFWEKVGSASENAARVQLYSNLIKEDKSHAEAAFEARDLLDFTMRGEANVVQFLIQITPFLNARMQGLYKLGRAIADKENIGNFAFRGAMLMAASLALWSFYKDDDEYKELEDWDRWSYYHFWIGDKHFRIPKPFEVGAIFSSLPESMANVLNGDEELKHVGNFIGHTANETFAIGFPQLFSPIIEQWANRNSYTGRPIIGERLAGLKPEEQKEPWTSEAVQLAGKLNISPKRAESLIQGYFSTFGMFLLSGSDIIVRNLFDFPERPSKRIDDYPIVGRFIKQKEPSRYTRQQTWFYDTFNEIDKIANTISLYKKMGDLDKVFELQKEAKQLKFAKFFRRERSKISDLNFSIRKILNSKVLSSGEKRKLLDKLLKKKNIMLKSIYQRLHGY